MDLPRPPGTSRPHDLRRPVFKDLLFHRRTPVYVAFDVLFADGEDVRAAPLRSVRRSSPASCAGTGFRTPSRCGAKALRRSRPCAISIWRASSRKGLPMPTRRRRNGSRILNSQKDGRAELFERKYG
jgi:hypothetical protein